MLTICDRDTQMFLLQGLILTVIALCISQCVEPAFYKQAKASLLQELSTALYK